MSDEVWTTLDRLIREVLPRRFRNAALSGDRSLHGDLGIDSMSLMSLAFRVQEEFEIDLMEHADRVAIVDTVDDLVRLVRELGKREGEVTIASGL